MTKSLQDMICDDESLSEPETECTTIHSSTAPENTPPLRRRISHLQNRSSRIFVEVRWGPPGMGKRVGVQQHYAGQYFQYLGCNNLHGTGLRSDWRGYRGQSILLIDNFNDKLMSLPQLLAMLDPHERRLEVQGGFIQRKWHHVVIISETHPSSWYAQVPNLQHDREVLKTIINRVTAYGVRAQDSMLLDE